MRLTLALLCLLAASPAYAEQGDRMRGAALADQGRNGVPACRSCHGDKGIGDGSGAFPRLTGQLGFYLYKQLKDFAAGTRPSPVMSPIAAALSDREMQDVAAYYSSVQGPFFPLPILDAKLAQRGGMISAAGIPERNVPACIACHGPAASGMQPSFPYLAGQYAPYLEYQLDQFRLNRRQNSPLNVMNDIAARMTEDDMRAVSEYLAAVRPPDLSRIGASSTGPASPYTGAPLATYQGTR
ncbi:MAG TPA: c-type cytochrome [Acetobacteraceae bacterium]|nr:c-type cytochrome [Acetobacteraceae bacterium]